MQRSNLDWIWIVIVVAVSVLLVAGIGMMSFGSAYPGTVGYSYVSGPFEWWGVLLMLFWLLIIMALVGLAVWAVRTRRPSPGVRVGPSENLEAARQRCAKVEIAKEQCDRMKRGLP
jgi:uncharacterized membrane protein